MEDQKVSSEILRQEIKSQSEKEAAKILEQAEQEAQVIIERARSEAETIKAERMKKAETQAEAVRKRILSGVRLELKRQALEGREEVMVKIFKAVEEKFRAFMKKPEYLDFIKMEVMEGVAALDGEKFQVISGELERNLLNRSVLKQLEEAAHKQHGRGISLTLSERIPSDGGVVIATHDGKTQFNNRISARIDRLKNELRLLIIKQVFNV